MREHAIGIALPGLHNTLLPRDYLSLMMAPTTSSIASVTRLVGRLKLLVRIEKQTLRRILWLHSRRESLPRPGSGLGVNRALKAQVFETVGERSVDSCHGKSVAKRAAPGLRRCIAQQLHHCMRSCQVLPR